MERDAPGWPARIYARAEVQHHGGDEDVLQSSVHVCVFSRARISAGSTSDSARVRTVPTIKDTAMAARSPLALTSLNRDYKSLLALPAFEISQKEMKIALLSWPQSDHYWQVQPILFVLDLRVRKHPDCARRCGKPPVACG